MHPVLHSADGELLLQRMECLDSVSGFVPAGMMPFSLGLGTGMMGQLHFFPGIARSFSILFISKPPATRGRECYIFMGMYI